MINIFFTIASNKYGYGHLKRCEIISNKFKKDINWIVLMNKRVDKKIMKNNSSIKYLSLSKFQKQLKKKNVEFIIKYIFLDFANSKFIKKNKSFQKLDFIKHLSKNILFIDDLSLAKFYKKFKTKEFKDIKVLRPYADIKESGIISGEKFSILNEKLKKFANRKININMKKILLSFGGSDLNNYSLKVLRSLKNFKYDISIVIGPFFKKKNLDLLKKINPKIKIIKNKSFLGRYFKESDLVVTTCGITKYEIAAMRIPALIIPISQISEKKNYYFSKLGTSISLEYQPSIRKIRNSILKLNDFNLRKSLFNSCRRVDFEGLNRILSKLNLKI
jgi:UDP-2,4-diacetamido-2,4,6-trideoxy-beta-L-altropyranose hydrolase